MSKTVLGIFADQENAVDAIEELKDLGYNPKDLSIVMKDEVIEEQIARDTGADFAGGAASGATTGAILGGLAGLVAAFAIPGLGAFFIGGPIAAALGLTGAVAATTSGAVTGAVAGGLLGALMGLGLSEDEAETYEAHIRAGGILVAVPARTDEEAEVEDILADTGANDIRTVGGEERVARFEDEEVVDRTGEYAYAGVKGGKRKIVKRTK